MAGEEKGFFDLDGFMRYIFARSKEVALRDLILFI